MKNFFLLLMFCSIPTFFYAQESTILPDKACINCTTTQDASAVVDIQSTKKGMLIPRMNTPQRTGIASPAKGLLVFDNTTSSFWYYDGDTWVSLAGGSGDGGSSQWTASGTDIYNANSGNVGIGTTSPISESHLKGDDGLLTLEGSTHSFMQFYPKGIQDGRKAWFGFGTPDAPDMSLWNHDNGSLRFATNNLERMRIASNGNVGIGAPNAVSPLQIKQSGDVSLTTHGSLVIGSTTATNIAMDVNEIQGRNNGAASPLSLNYEGGNVIIGGPTDDTRFNFKNNGTLGLGVLTPATKLHVKAGIGTSIVARIESQNDNGATIDFRDPNSTGAFLARIGGKGDGLTFIAGGSERMQIDNNGNVGIGASPLSSNFDYKLHIDASDVYGGISIKSENSTENSNQTGMVVDIHGLGANIGISSRAVALSNSSFGQTGVRGATWGGTGTNIGVHGHGTGGSTKYGIYGSLTGSCTGCYAGYFDGDLAYTGTMIDVSDKKFKEKINTLDDAIAKIMNLKPKTYQFKKYKDFNFAQGKQYGFIAQELQKEIPELVTQNVHPHFDENNEAAGKTEYLGINYIHLIPILTKGIQEQQQLIESQNNKINNQQIQLEEKDQQIANLIDRLSTLETTVQQILDGQKGETGEVHKLNKAASLLQNQPNPFNENTQIKYYIPEEAQKAQLQITAIDGRIIDSFLLQKGAASITLDAGQLAAGNYIYTLIIDGKIVSSKQMVLTK